jgi:hypothetical protein
MKRSPTTKITGSVDTRRPAMHVLKPIAVISAPKRLSGRRSPA